MRIIPTQSTYQTATLKENTLHVTNKQFTGFPEGVDKANEYSWFYILALEAHAGQTITIRANLAPNEPLDVARHNSLVYHSINGQKWHQLTKPIKTNLTGLQQEYTWTHPTNGTYLISNTIFHDYKTIKNYTQNYVENHSNICHLKTIGTSLQGRPLEIITFTPTRTDQKTENGVNSNYELRITNYEGYGRPRGRILLTTGCHPAEPDFICAQAILNYLASDEAKTLRQHYTIDVMPLQNPDGAATRSCLTANGINLYWNFRKDDKENCPEAYYLWQYIKTNPPLLYLDFHAYVHQYHRHPMPYLIPLNHYTSRPVKKLVKTMDHQLINLSNGYYRIGTLSTWPDALSAHTTKEFNTIAYTKYHINLNEGRGCSRRRALEIFHQLTDLLQNHHATTSHILLKPHGTVAPDITDTSLFRSWYRAKSYTQQAWVYLKSYARYYRLRRHG